MSQRREFRLPARGDVHPRANDHARYRHTAEETGADVRQSLARGLEVRRMWHLRVRNSIRGLS